MSRAFFFLYGSSRFSCVGTDLAPLAAGGYQVKTSSVRCALAVVGLLGLAPVAASQQTTSGSAVQSVEKKSPRDHLTAAKQSVDRLDNASFSADSTGRIADLKRRLAALERSYVAFGTKTMTKQETASGSTRYKVAHTGDWSAHVADIDTIFAQLVDSKAPIARAADQDDVLKGKLREARAHFTAFAVAASGTGGTREKPNRP